MRLFIAIEFDDNIISALTGLQADMKSQGVTGKFTKQENLHLTLAFIGDYGNPVDVLNVMEQVPFKEFSIKLNGVGNFGELFWAGIDKNDELNAYVRRLRSVLADAGISYDKKKFSPHITLIRKTAYRGAKAIPVMEVPRGEMLVRRISLMRSERGKNGMIYTEVGSMN